MKYLLFCTLLLQSLIMQGQTGDPSAILGAITEKSASVKKILANPLLNVHQDGERSKFWVINFKLTIISPEGEVLADDSDSNGKSLSNYQKKIIKNLPKGSKLNFHSIVAVCPDCRSALLPDYTMEVE
jgi:hypothetical protein